MAALKLCRTCQHWRKSGLSSVESSARPGFCSLIDTYPADDVLVGISASGNATLYTAPTFGCVLWAPIPQENSHA